MEKRKREKKKEDCIMFFDGVTYVTLRIIVIEEYTKHVICLQ